MYRRIRMAASAAVVALAMLAPGFAFAQPAPFNDLGSVPWATQAINSLASQGVLLGIGNGAFGPDLSLTRAEMATVLGRLKHWQPGAQAAARRFHDYSAIPAYALPYVGMAAQLGIVQGFPNGNFQPQGTLTWADLAIIVAHAFNYPTVAQAQVAGLLGQLVNGAQTPSWAQQAVAEDVQAGDFSGILAELYSPNATVTRAELALFLDQAATGSTATPSSVASLTMTPTPIAAAGSLAAGQSVTVTLSADNASGAPVAGATVYLSFVPASGGGTASVGGTALGATPAAFTAGSDGTVTVTYTAPATLPTSGTDTITAGNAASGATVTGTDSYSFSSTATTASVAGIQMLPTPIGAAGSLAAGQSVAVNVYADDASGTPIAGATLYLSFIPASGGGTASVGGTALGSAPAAFTTGSNGAVTVTYTTPATLPTGGTDTITAGNAASGATVTATDSYSFSSTTTAPSVATIGLTPNPVATGGTLAAGQAVTVTATAEDSGGAPIAGATLYLSFTPASGGGTASVGGTALTATPAAFTTGSDGTVSITYTAPATLPTGGTDTITAGNAASGATVTATDSYTFTTTSAQVSGATVQQLSITVTTASGTQSYPLAANVTVTMDGQAATLSDIATGDTVTLTLNAQGQVTAVDITSAPNA